MIKPPSSGTQPYRSVAPFASPLSQPPMVVAEQSRILVTGGAGFIGSAVVWGLNRRGLSNIVITDYLDPGKKWNELVPLTLGHEEKQKNLRPLRFIDFIEADVFRARLLKKPDAFGRFATILHLGACSSTTETNEAFLIDNNFGATRELAVWALNQGARFIYASSAATYGDGSTGMDDQDHDLSRLRPLNRYGSSKHAFDLYAQREGLLDRIVGLKYFNVFGPNENHKGEMRSLVNKAYQQIHDTGGMKLFKSHRPGYRDGEQKRDFLYVKDAVEMTLHFAFGNKQAAGLYNIGSGTASTWLTLAGAIFAALHRPPAINFIEMPAELREKYQYFTWADIAKLRATGYVRPVISLAEPVRDYVVNYLTRGRRLGE